MAEWDRTVDLLVMGSGAAGVGAAVRGHDLGLDVLLVEKSELYGGNTAMSGGVCWVANNPGMAGEGIADSDEDGFAYLKHITKGEVSDDRLWLYIRESKRVLAYLHDKTHVRYIPLAKYTDYYPTEKKKAQRMYKRGKLNGPSVEYDEKGERKTSAQYVKDKLHGVYKQYKKGKMPDKYRDLMFDEEIDALIAFLSTLKDTSVNTPKPIKMY